MNYKKITIITLITFMFLGNIKLIAQSDFRNATWGMNSTAVKSVEKFKLISQNATSKTYECQLGDINGKLIYIFTSSNKLVRTKYYLTPEYLNINLFIKDYKMLQDLLTEKYGEPKSKSATAIRKREIPENEWTGQLSSGNLRLETKWSNAKTDIVLSMSKSDDKPTIQIDYISNEIAAIDLKEKKARIIKNI